MLGDSRLVFVSRWECLEKSQVIMKTFTNPRRFVDFTTNYLLSNTANPHVHRHF